MSRPNRRASRATCALLLAASVTLVLPAGAILCVDSGNHLVLEWSTTEGPCCDVATDSAEDSCAPGACDSCDDIVVTAAAALRAKIDGPGIAGSPLAVVMPAETTVAPAGRAPRVPRDRLGQASPSDLHTTILRL